MAASPWQATPLPTIEEHEELAMALQKLEWYFSKIIETSYSFDDLRLNSAGKSLDSLIRLLVESCSNVQIVCALLALRGYFASLEDDDGRHLNTSRGYACEVVAWRFVTCLPEHDAIQYLLNELPPVTPDPDEGDIEALPEEESPEHRDITYETSDEHSPLIDRATVSIKGPQADTKFKELASTLEGLNALEIGVVSDAKDFMSRRSTQDIIDGLWMGDIVLWTSIGIRSRKTPGRYQPRTSDPYCRLRVPRYLKIYEALFFCAFLLLYYLVLVDRQVQKITVPEVLLWIWLAAFTYDEFGQFSDAGLAFYAADFWSIWDFGIILIGIAYFVTRMTGIGQQSLHITDISLDILSLEALLLVPRTASILSLHPFFGPLIPVLRIMSIYAAKFMMLVATLFLGFLATFTLLARDNFTPFEMSWILIKVFFGSSYLGFDAADQISPIFGAPLMLGFVFLSNILLLTALISLLSNSLEEVMNRSRSEYLFQYSVYVLEASTSNRLTYFLPPFNLMSLLLRPLRFCLPADTLRAARIRLLRISHLPHVGMIQAFEALQSKLWPRYNTARAAGTGYSRTNAKTPQQSKAKKLSPSKRRLRFRRGASPSRPERVGATSDNSTREAPPPARHDHAESLEFARLCKQIQHLTDKVDRLANAQSSSA